MKEEPSRDLEAPPPGNEPVPDEPKTRLQAIPPANETSTPRGLGFRGLGFKRQPHRELTSIGLGLDPVPTAANPIGLARPGSGLPGNSYKALGIGLALGIATQFVPILQVLIHYMVVLVHELGHAGAGWVFGFPSIPAFDFQYGGGVTSHMSRSNLLAGAVFVGLAGLAIGQREIPKQSMGFGFAAAFYAASIWMGWDQILILAMGHGLELIFAGLFVYRAATGSGCRLEAERPLYGWLGFHIVFHDLAFAWGLASSTAARAQYGAAKGGGHWMDFSRLAQDIFLVPLETIALSFLMLTLLPIPVALILAQRHLAREVTAENEARATEGGRPPYGMAPPD